MTEKSLGKYSSQALAENKNPKPSYSKCFPQTAHGPLTSQKFFTPDNSSLQIKQIIHAEKTTDNTKASL